MKFSKFLTIFSLLFFASFSVVSASTYYVRVNGGGTTCTQARTDSQSTAFSTLNSTLSCVTAGDTIIMHGGIYDEDLNNTIFAGTSWSNPIRIAHYQNEIVTLSPSYSPNYVLYFNRNQQYIEFDGINFDGRSTLYGTIDIFEDTNGHPNHIRVKNSEITGRSDIENFLVILANFDVAYGLGGNEFINNKIHKGCCNNFEHGFYIKSPNNIIDGNDIYDVPGAGITLYNDKDTHADGNIIRNNKIHNPQNVPYQHVGIQIADTSSNTYVYNNLIYNITGGDQYTTGIQIYAGTNAFVYNNTVYNTHRGIWITGIWGGGTDIRNNISYGNDLFDFEDDLGAPKTFNNNLCGSGCNTNGNPQFLNLGGSDFHLTSASTLAIDKGTSISMVTTDITGAARIGTYDIGAYEYGAGGPTPLVGDINLDHIVNSLDWSYMNAHWFTSDSKADLNKDGLVNTLDFSLLNKNWFKTW